MSFRLVPKSVTLNDSELRNGPYFALFSRSLSDLLMSSCSYAPAPYRYGGATGRALDLRSTGRGFKSYLGAKSV